MYLDMNAASRTQNVRRLLHGAKDTDVRPGDPFQKLLLYSWQSTPECAKMTA
jgi:hypothetical protein